MKLLNIGKDNWEEVCEMTTNSDGIPTLYEEFVTSNAYSLLQCFFDKSWNCRAIEEAGQLLGFTMFGFCKEENFYEICRLMIDKKFQGKGFGRKALYLIIEEMKELYSCGEIYISAEEENKRALELYESIGFLPAGRFLEGEKLLCLKL